MQIQVASPVNQTIIFAVIFLGAVFLFIRRKKDAGAFPVSLTQELKGLAILMIVFSHIGYFLAADTRFLFPFSIFAGVGVNIFLFLSGFGLATSAGKKSQTIFESYRHRLARLFIPLWLALAGLLALDFILLQKTYPLNTVIASLAGFFPQADIFNSLDSPLWYFTLIFFYYLIFPLLFEGRHPFVSALLIFLASYFILSFNLPIKWDVLKLYRLHLWAFPLGVAFAGLMAKPTFWSKLFPTRLEKILLRVKRFKTLGRLTLIIILLLAVGYFGLHSGIGESVNKEQLISLITVFAIVGIFLAKKIEFKLLYLFGLYSYEIYLWHWPILFRFDFIYKFLPAGAATIAYLALFLFLGWGFNKLGNFLAKKIS